MSAHALKSAAWEGQNGLGKEKGTGTSDTIFKNSDLAAAGFENSNQLLKTFTEFLPLIWYCWVKPSGEHFECL